MSISLKLKLSLYFVIMIGVMASLTSQSMGMYLEAFNDTRRAYASRSYTTIGTEEVVHLSEVLPATPVFAQRDRIKTPLNPNHVGQEGTPESLITYTNFDTLRAAHALRTNYGDRTPIRIINYANAYTVGGGILVDNSGAQEEGLMRVMAGLYDSLLDDSISREGQYIFNEDPSLNRQLTDESTTGAYITYNVPTIRGSVSDGYPYVSPFFVDVITSAAYNLGDPTSDGSGRKGGIKSPDEYSIGMHDRIRTQFHAAANYGIISGIKPIAIIGLYGCGAFQNKAELVGRFYADVLDEYAFKGAFERVVVSLYPGDDSRAEDFRRSISGKSSEGTRNTTFRIDPLPYLQ